MKSLRLQFALPMLTALVCAGIVTTPQPGLAKGTLIVVSPLESVQAALNRAKPGDVVLVQGEHTESLVVPGGITLKGEPTTVLKSETGPVLKIQGVKGVRVERLRLHSSRFRPETRKAEGAVEILGSQAEVRECSLQSNSDGILVDGNSEVVLTRNTIHLCGESGLHFMGRARGTVSENDIQSCWLHGILVAESAAPTLVQNTVRQSQHAGIGYFGKAHGEARHNLIRKSVRFGIFATNESAPNVYRNTVVEGDGVGIFHGSSATVSLQGNVVTRNRIGLKWSPPSPKAAPPLGRNLIADNKEKNYDGLEAPSLETPTLAFTQPNDAFVLADTDGAPSQVFGWSGRTGVSSELSRFRQKQPPVLVATVEFVEPSGNRALDAEEAAKLTLQVANKGKGRATGLKATLRVTTSNSGLEFPAVVECGSLEPGETRTVPITIRGARTLAQGKVGLEINVVDAFDYDAAPLRTVFETRAFAAPRLAVQRVATEDGNGNQLLERGEQIDLKAVVVNSGGLARDVRAKLVVGDDRIKAVGEDVVDWDLIPAGGSKEVQFSLLVLNRYDGPAQLPVTLALSGPHLEASVTQPLVLSLNQTGPRYIEQEIQAQALQVPAGPSPAVPQDAIDDAPVVTAPNPDAMAVVIGIERYNAAVPTLQYARRDALTFRDYLIKTLGVPAENIVFLADEEATGGNIRTALEGKLAAWTHKGRSDVYVYYAGHGAPDSSTKTPFLVPFDGDPSYPGTSCYSLAAAYQALSRLEARSVTVVLDSCFSGLSGRGDEARALLSNARPLFIESDAAAVPAGVTVFAAASGEQMSSGFDRARHGLFTYYFLKGLRGEADLNGDKAITNTELQAYVAPLVTKEARRLNRTQTPVLLGTQQERVLRNVP